MVIETACSVVNPGVVVVVITIIIVVVIIVVDYLIIKTFTSAVILVVVVAVVVVVVEIGFVIVDSSLKRSTSGVQTGQVGALQAHV